MTTQNIQNNEKFDDIESLNIWNEDMQDEFISGALSSSNNIITQDGTVKCYITRNIPIKYKCSKTSLLYGEGIGQNGMQAKTECENECYEQHGCVNLVKEPEIEKSDIESLKINTLLKNEDGTDITEDKIKKEDSVKATLNTLKKLEKISFKVFGNNIRGTRAYLDIGYTNRENKTQYLVKQLLVEEGASLNLTVRDIVKEIEFKLYTNDNEVERRLENIELVYGSNQKFICPRMQDITNVNPGDYAHICPSGKIITFKTGTTDYQICADYGIVGDNIDGTFSSQDACYSVCRENFSCKLDVISFNTEILKEFQEGCIEGQDNCEINTCKDLRLIGSRVINENVFKGGEHPTQTIINSTQQAGVKRPRVLLEEDLDYLERHNEEWKDEAYKYMLDNNTFSQSVFLLNEDTNTSTAYNIGQRTGSNYGDSINSSRALYAIIKPKAYDVHNDTSYKFYIVIDTFIEKFMPNESAELQKSKDRILYLRTSDTNDIFKPFAIKRDFARNILLKDNTDGTPFIQEHFENQASSWSFESFKNNKWHFHSSSNIAESFKYESIILGERPYLRLQAIDNLNNLVFSLPGLVRSITTNGLYETKNYTGSYDGTGDALARFNVYVYYTSQDLTYNDLLEMIEDNELKPFYDNLTPSAYPKEVVGDEQKINSNIAIYQYGTIKQKSAYIRIFPKKTEIGKKGFIYVFGY